MLGLCRIMRSCPLRFPSDISFRNGGTEFLVCRWRTRINGETFLKRCAHFVCCEATSSNREAASRISPARSTAFSQAAAGRKRASTRELLWMASRIPRPRTRLIVTRIASRSKSSGTTRIRSTGHVDLNNFRLLFDLRAIDMGVIVTRATELQSIFNSLGKEVELWKFDHPFRQASAAHRGRRRWRMSPCRLCHKKGML